MPVLPLAGAQLKPVALVVIYGQLELPSARFSFKAHFGPLLDLRCLAAPREGSGRFRNQAAAMIRQRPLRSAAGGLGGVRFGKPAAAKTATASKAPPAAKAGGAPGALGSLQARVGALGA
jgi:hypothetical protein